MKQRIIQLLVAFAIIVALLGAFFFSSEDRGNYLPERCLMNEGFACAEYSIQTIDDSEVVLLRVLNQKQYPIVVRSMHASVHPNINVSCTVDQGAIGINDSFAVECRLPSYTARYAISLHYTYINAGLMQVPNAPIDRFTYPATGEVAFE